MPEIQLTWKLRDFVAERFRQWPYCTDVASVQILAKGCADEIPKRSKQPSNYQHNHRRASSSESLSCPTYNWRENGADSWPSSLGSRFTACSVVTGSNPGNYGIPASIQR